MKIELISPFQKDPFNLGNAFHLPQMALPLIASLTPSDVEISITDEMIQPLNFDKEVDLVGITVNTKTAQRAYEIADEFRSRHVPVILGGIHPTVVKHEALQHANALVVGEAERVWAQLVGDFENGKLRNIYRFYRFPSLEDSPPPKRDLFQEDKYGTINLVQTSRGCPYACHFCSVSAIYGRGMRLRPIDKVFVEIRTLKGNSLLFVDDNIVGSTGYAKQLLTELIPLKKKWVGQASITIANNKEMLKLLARSGCQGLCVGFETTSVDCLKEAGKIQNVKNDYFESVKKLHDNGISILGSFILGFDNDDKSCFEKLLEFAFKSKIDVVYVSILTPYPGTPLYKKMKKEKRLIDDKWWLKYNDYDVVYRPKLMTREQLQEGWIWTTRELYKLGPTLSRCFGGLGRRSLFGNILNWKVNMGLRKKPYTE